MKEKKLQTGDDEGKVVDTEPPVSEDAFVFSQHDCELPISLAKLQKYGDTEGVHLASMAKRKNIEENCGV